MPWRSPRRFVVPSALLVAGLLASAAAAKNWSEWGAPARIAELNTPFVEGCASLSPDGLELWFTSGRPGGLGGTDIWVARRASMDSPFGPAQNAGAPINSAAPEACPTMRPGGWLVWTSLRVGAGDLYRAKLDRRDGSWSQFSRYGSNINSPDAIDESASFYETESGDEVMVFSSGRGGGRSQIYQSVNGGPAELVGGGVASQTAASARPSVSKDGLEIFFDSNRQTGNIDFWTARRSSTSQPWGTAERLSFSSSEGTGAFFQLGFDARPAVSWDGSRMVFASFRSGGPGLVDLFEIERTKVTGQD
jgi:Tol biopolymer transport system component